MEFCTAPFYPRKIYLDELNVNATYGGLGQQPGSERGRQGKNSAFHVDGALIFHVTSKALVLTCIGQMFPGTRIQELSSAQIKQLNHGPAKQRNMNCDESPCFGLTIK